MARLARLCIPGWPHLLVQRGHDRHRVFVDDADRALYRELLQASAAEAHVQIHAYALRDDEVRLLVTPSTGEGLGKLIQSIGRRYVARYNRRHGRSGSLWEGRFRATVVDPEQRLLASMLYVEQGGGAHDAIHESAWTSAPHHLGTKTDPLITEPAAFWRLGNTPFDREAAYRRVCELGLTDTQLTEITNVLNAGWPLGDERFRAALAGMTPRRLDPRPRGRPRKLGN